MAMGAGHIVRSADCPGHSLWSFWQKLLVAFLAKQECAVGGAGTSSNVESKLVKVNNDSVWLI